MSFVAATVLIFSLMVLNLLVKIKSAPVINDVQPVNAKDIVSKASCPFEIDSDVNEERIPVRIDRIKCQSAPEMMEGTCCHEPGYQCVQAFEAINVTFFTKIDKQDLLSILADDSKDYEGDSKIIISDSKHGLMVGTHSYEERVEAGCFCAKLNGGTKDSIVLPQLHFEQA